MIRSIVRTAGRGWTSEAGMGTWPASGGGAAMNSFGSEWVQPRSAIAAALRPHPEALGAVKEALVQWNAA